jgi:hypothetical protein
VIPYNKSYEKTIAHVKEMCSGTGALCVYSHAMPLKGVEG